MRVIKITIFIVLLSLMGCEATLSKVASPKRKMLTSDHSDKNYSVELIEFDRQNHFEFHEVYNNKLSIIELNDDYSSNRLFFLDLSNYEFTEIYNLKKEDKNNRIWNFIELSNKKYLYTEISYQKFSDFELIHFAVKINNNSDVTILTEGYINDIYSLPVFHFHNDYIYFTISSLDFKKDPSFGNYRVEIWKGNVDEFLCIKEFIGGYSDFYLNLETLFLYNHNLYFLDDKLCYLAADGKEIYFIKSDNYQMISTKIPLNEKFIDLFPVCNDLVMIEWNGKIGSEEKKSIYLFDKELKKHFLNNEYYFEDYCILSRRTVAYYQGKIVELQSDGKHIFLNEIEEIEFGTYFRKIDENSLLVFYGPNICYKITFKT